jgi:hypothetical protein
LVISSLLPSLGGLDRAEAGFASKLADTHRFRIINAEDTYTGDWELTGEVS